MSGKPCPDCGAAEGQIHEWGCGYEDCPLCGRGVHGPCTCVDQHLGLPSDRDLTDEEEAIWRKHLEEIGRVPFIDWPQYCTRCGQPDPGFFMVQDDEWDHYIPIDHRGDLLCEPCYEQIKAKIDLGRKLAGSPYPEEGAYPNNALRELHKTLHDLRSASLVIYVMSSFDESLSPDDIALLDEIDGRVLLWAQQLEERFGRIKTERPDREVSNGGGGNGDGPD